MNEESEKIKLFREAYKKQSGFDLPEDINLFDNYQINMCQIFYMALDYQQDKIDRQKLQFKDSWTFINSALEDRDYYAKEVDRLEKEIMELKQLLISDDAKNYESEYK